MTLCSNFLLFAESLRKLSQASIHLSRKVSSRISALTISRQSQNSPNMTAVFNKPAVQKQNFDFFLVLDFEATCVKDSIIDPQEIIEFPVLKINGTTFETEAHFHQYVQPEVHKQLSPFCTELTGIIQEQVDDQPNLEQTLKLFDDWMNEQGLLGPNVRSIFVTCGDWDLQTMLPKQCRHFGLHAPMYFKQWINIKKPFCDVTGTYPKGMMPMLHMLNISHIGRHHSGIDDCRNIANILRSLAERSYIFKPTKQLEY